MTIAEIKRQAELYSALAEGKTMQVKNMDGEWADVKPEKLNYIPEELVFRIKPELKYRPFHTQEECWEEMHKHPDFGWVKYKNNKSYIQISVIGNNITLKTEYGYGFNYIFDNFLFTDGTPFGIKEE